MNRPVNCLLSVSDMVHSSAALLVGHSACPILAVHQTNLHFALVGISHVKLRSSVVSVFWSNKSRRKGNLIIKETFVSVLFEADMKRIGSNQARQL
ncbi:hypothetical protein AKJ16_DCAP08121, partial [Drosera capensis]